MNVSVEKIEELRKLLPDHINAKFTWSADQKWANENYSGSFASFIDHTLLKANAKHCDVEKLCLEAVDNDFFSVCIAPSHIPIAKKFLKDQKVKICTVIGFPLGNQTSATKTFETRTALEIGAEEIDMVLNVSALLSQKYDYIFQEIETIKQICGNKILKVILETCYLSDEQIALACMLSKAAGADFVKTSTGFGSTGATKDHIKLMRSVVGNQIGVKASGGIRTKEDAKAMVNAGASRLGCSSGMQILGVTSKQIEGNY